MRILLGALALATLLNLACQSCPDGNAENSLFCHGASCAASEAVCGGACANLQADRDNCGACGNRCGDGLVCSLGMCVEGCENGLANCDGACVDLATDEANCGGCGATDSAFTCAPSETCTGGVCGCDPGELVCGGTCTDPLTSNTHCGATGDCLGPNAGETCGANQACLGGDCVSTLIYRGSLAPTTGNWQYQGMPGLTGANAECNLRWPGSQVCTYEKLQMASMTNPPETINAIDSNSNPVTQWWVDNPNEVMSRRCGTNGVAWTYGTADLGNVGTFVAVTRATGAIGGLTIEGLPSCTTARAVPCCSTVTAP